ncbi:MAG TPA: EamA family transporter [Clostridiales bacterium]|jgi:drug/metabolite transporter (DMT)-like permease|nr:EamA family transporter [Clostridiales bacterium]
MKKRKLLGQISVFGSAIIFGFTPVLAAISYRGGNNGINMAFLRALLPIPLLLWIGRKMPWPRKGQWKRGLFAGCLSFGCMLLLYTSYEHISPGLATTLHFLYPMYVAVYEAARAKKRPGKRRVFGLSLAFAGTLLFIERGESGSFIGLGMAIGSGIFYAAYIIALGKEAKDPMPIFRLILLVSLSGVFMCGLLGVAMNKITFSISPLAWLCAISVTLFAAVLGSTLFQYGVRVVGEANAALFSLFEPIVSVLFSVWLLNDTLSVRKIMGSILILSSLFITQLPGKRKATVKGKG